MIKIKNPYTTDVGYHFTESSNLNSILDKGIVPVKLDKELTSHAENTLLEYNKENKKDNIIEIIDEDLLFIEYFIFDKKRPVFLTISSNIETSVKDYIESKNLRLKLDCSSFDCFPDYHTLLIDHYFKIFLLNGILYLCIDLYKSKISKDIAMYIMEKYNATFKYDFISKEPLIYNEKNLKNIRFVGISFKDLKKDIILHEMLINYTKCFCINNIITSDKILDMLLI